jgi:hypothetical protein
MVEIVSSDSTRLDPNLILQIQAKCNNDSGSELEKDS